jgi:hypothetical protein
MALLAPVPAGLARPGHPFLMIDYFAGGEARISPASGSM